MSGGRRGAGRSRGGHRDCLRVRARCGAWGGSMSCCPLRGFCGHAGGGMPAGRGLMPPFRPRRGRGCGLWLWLWLWLWRSRFRGGRNLRMVEKDLNTAFFTGRIRHLRAPRQQPCADHAMPQHGQKHRPPRHHARPAATHMRDIGGKQPACGPVLLLRHGSIHCSRYDGPRPI